tara:strand:- start:378 stop:1100 length:723 start_codon:yes stop_codon:yes gene_type:complete
MELDIQNLFHKIEKAQLQTEPFDHLVIDGFLPSIFFKELARELEVEDFPNNYTRAPYGNKERFGVDITDYCSWKASGRRILTTIDEKNYNSISSKDTNKHIRLFIDLLLKNEKHFYSLLASRLPTERNQDNYFFHINMTKDGIGYRIEPHPDDKHNIFTILFYTPETDENKQFGLHVYKDKQGRPAMGKEIHFMPNRMVIFAPSLPNSSRPATWHEVRRLSSNLVGTRNSFQMFFYKNSN